MNPPERSNKHIVICNERILFRFGVDRILVEMAKMFVEQGCRVTFVCLRCDEQIVKAITPHVFIVDTTPGGDLYQVEADSARFLEQNWRAIGRPAPVDAIVSGGWPFFNVATFCDRVAIPSIFIDAGAVPHDELDENARSAQRAVRRLRAASLAHFDRVLPISAFIEQTQTIPDRGSSAGVHIVPLGVDHLAGKVFGGDGPLADSEQILIVRLESLLARKTSLILNLGRFEAVGYKNSNASFDLLRDLRRRAGDTHRRDYCLLVLANADQIELPADVEGHVVCLGTPGDDALLKIMSLACVGFSPSLWEGFNLPIGEMQILGKPVFAFNVGAHPEVVLHPWFLCANVAEAAAKIDDTLSGRMPEGLLDARKVDAYREKFAWRHTLAAYFGHTLEAIQGGKTTGAPSRLLLVDVTNSSRDTANSGVVRVTRRLSAELQRRDDLQLIFVRWDAERSAYRFVSGDYEHLLAGYSGPRPGFGWLTSRRHAETTPDDMLRHLPGRLAADMTLLVAEVVLDGQCADRIEWARSKGLRTAAILYDLIPIEFPQYCGEELCETFPIYLEALALADQTIGISAYSLGRFSAYLERNALAAPAQLDVAWLPGQLGALNRVRTARPSRARDISIVCVSTIEPRKNHRTLLAAYKMFRTANPNLNVRLTLIGNSYDGASELATEIRDAVAKDPTIVWRVAISDDELTEAMRAAAFTVYPSLVEGFGLPILESLWMGVPCICSDDGVMAELAVGGGCLTADVSDAGALAKAIESLAGDAPLRERLAEQARRRDIADWSDYAQQVATLLSPQAGPNGVPPVQRHAAGRAGFRNGVVRDACFLRHRLSGLGSLGHATSTPGRAEDSHSADHRRAAAGQERGVAGRAGGFSWWTRLVGARELSARRVRKSGLFSADWYLAAYPDVREAGIDPLEHFTTFGHKEGRSPGPDFDSPKYLTENPDLADTGLSPFEHFLRYGRRS